MPSSSSAARSSRWMTLGRFPPVDMSTGELDTEGPAASTAAICRSSCCAAASASRRAATCFGGAVGEVAAPPPLAPFNSDGSSTGECEVARGGAVGSTGSPDSEAGGATLIPTVAAVALRFAATCAICAASMGNRASSRARTASSAKSPAKRGGGDAERRGGVDAVYDAADELG